MRGNWITPRWKRCVTVLCAAYNKVRIQRRLHAVAFFKISISVCARKITLIADNYVIHKSAMMPCFLAYNTKFEILFQPVYPPWVNKIELLWKQRHDNITRNHRYSTLNQLMIAARTFMNGVSPYPGTSVQFLQA